MLSTSGTMSQARKQPPFELGIEPRFNRHIPEPVLSQTLTFYGIFLSHQDRLVVLKLEIGSDKGVMIGKGMLQDTDITCLQIAKKPSWIADTGNGVNLFAAEPRQGTGYVGIDQIHGPLPHQGHQIFPPLYRTVAYHEIHASQPSARLP